MNGKSGTGTEKRVGNSGTERENREREKIIFPVTGKNGIGKRLFFPEKSGKKS